MSDQTWLNIENGRGASERKLAQVERALDWPPGTIDAIVNDHNEEPPIEVSDRDRLLTALCAEDLTGDEIERLIRYVRRLRRTRPDGKSGAG